MAMIDDSSNYSRETMECRNCTKFLGYFIKIKGQPVLGHWFCNLKCIEDYETKQKKTKERITEKTLSS